MSKRILVVEDQPDNRQIIRDMLAPTDYEITEAENGEEALAAIAKQRTLRCAQSRSSQSRLMRSKADPTGHPLARTRTHAYFQETHCDE